MEFERVECDASNFVNNSVEWIVKAINEILAKQGSCIVGLSGGSTPFPIYDLLGKRSDVDWTKVIFYMIDERYVPVDHKDSNTGAVYKTLISHGLIPKESFLPPPVHLPYDECVSEYDKTIKKLIQESKSGKIDLNILGLGPDGHLASLFPDVPAEVVQASNDSTRFVIGTTTEVFAVKERITTNYTVLNNCNISLFLLKGRQKIEVLEQTVEKAAQESRWPAKPIVQHSTRTVAIYELE